MNQLIEQTFRAPELSLLAGLQDNFLKNRKGIFDPDRNNFAPRLGLAYAHNFFGQQTTVLRAGYGLFYDQALGAVVSQSRNVFPNFLTLNTGGGTNMIRGPLGFGAGVFTVFNSGFALPLTAGDSNGYCFAPRLSSGACPPGQFATLVVPGTLNQFNRAEFDRLSGGKGIETLVTSFASSFSNEFGFTLPANKLPMPLAHQYSFTVEQSLGVNWVATAAYVGTQGRNLLRLTTPNLGPNLFVPTVGFDFIPFTPKLNVPHVAGYRATPGQQFRPLGTQTPNLDCQRNPGNVFCLRPVGGRPVNGLGAVFIYETTGESRYDSLQLQLRGRFRTALQLQVAYTFGKALDEVSDVFDLAGAPALPQRSCKQGESNCDYADERGVANFDVRHRLAYGFTYRLPRFSTRSQAYRLFLGGFELAGAGQFQTGQPFTVSSLNDYNLDGNLTDRPNSVLAIKATSNRSRPFERTSNNPGDFYGTLGGNGAVGRNTLRASNFLLLNLALIKNFALTERQAMTLRVEAFNFIDRANFGVPVRFLEVDWFGKATDTVTPGRRIQFALKYSF